MVKSSRDRIVALVIFIFLVLMLTTAGQWGLIETSEARYAEISREMVQSGDWLHPTLLNIYHYHKPPLTYWLTAISFSMFGINEFAVRFFLTFAFFLQVLLISKISRLLFEEKEIALFTAVVYATLPMILISVRGLTTDAYLNTFILLSLFCWIRYLKSGNVLFVYAFGLAIAMGFLTKGPAVFVVPAFAILGLWKVISLPNGRVIHYILAFILSVVVGFSWFAYVIYQDPRLADYFFFHHLVDRLSHAEVFTRSEPWYYYLLVIPLVSLPWITVFVGGFFTKTSENGTGVHKLIKRIGLWWFLLPLTVFSVASSKLVLYILPLFIGFSIVTAFFLAQGISKLQRLLFFGLVALVLVGIGLVPFVIQGVNSKWWLAMMPTFSLLIGVWLLRSKFPCQYVIPALSILFAINLVLYASFFFRFNSLAVNSTRQICDFIAENHLDNRNIIVYDELLPSLAFELDREIISVYAGDHNANRETQFEKDDHWKNSFIDATDQREAMRFKELLASKTVLVVKTKKSFPQLKTFLEGDWQQQTMGKWTLYYN
jgi:4-amino-4-deoxy-L-arabinose transferase-like glycosyltransferase